VPQEVDVAFRGHDGDQGEAYCVRPGAMEFAWCRPQYRHEQALDGWTKVFGFLARTFKA
jgi:hypothetical protein